MHPAWAECILDNKMFEILHKFQRTLRVVAFLRKLRLKFSHFKFIPAREGDKPQWNIQSPREKSRAALSERFSSPEWLTLDKGPLEIWIKLTRTKERRRIRAIKRRRIYLSKWREHETGFAGRNYANELSLCFELFERFLKCFSLIQFEALTQFPAFFLGCRNI